MLFLKRVLTSSVLFIILFIALSVDTIVVVGGVVGARAGAGNPDVRDFKSGYAVGRAAGYEVGKKYGRHRLARSIKSWQLLVAFSSWRLALSPY